MHARKGYCFVWKLDKKLVKIELIVNILLISRFLILETKINKSFLVVYILTIKSQIAEFTMESLIELYI